MDRGDPDFLERLFEQAKALPPEDQQAFLEAACAGDPAVEAELRSLIATANEAESFFDILADAVLSLSPWPPASPSEPTATPPDADPLIGRSVRQYRIEEQLGRGGMGVVYLAHDTVLHRPVALKFLPHHITPDEELAERFLVEARAAGALDHPNVCTVYEIGESGDGRRFIAMAYYEGETLKQKLTSGPLPIEEAKDYARQIAAALEAAHKRDIVHRDIKPGNVIVSPDGLAKVLDFGLAKLADVTVTRTGSTMGTVAYMSPEQTRGKEADHRTDLWSLGVVLYEMLTGERPFKGESNAVVIHAIQEEEPEPISALRPEVDLELEGVVSRLLAKDREQRPASVEAAGLGPGEATLPKRVFAKPSGPWARVRSWATVAVMVIAIATIVLWSFSRGPSAPDRTDGLPEATVAVFPFENHSGDATLDDVGEYVAFAIMDGLNWMDEGTVLSRDAVLQTLASAGDGASVQEIAADLGAGTSITGTFMLLGDTLRFEAEVTAVASGELLHPVTASGIAADREGVIETLRQRVMGAIATTLGDERTNLGISRAPSYDAYQAWARGIELLDVSNYQESLEYFRDAYRLDTTFVFALIGVMSAYAYMGLPSKLDSVVGFLEARRSELRPVDQLWVREFRAGLQGDRMGQLDVVRAILRYEPVWWGHLVQLATAAGRPDEALQVWEDVEEGRIESSHLSPYKDSPDTWFSLTRAQHMTARYSEQLITAGRAREQFPDDLRGWSHEIQALFALDRFGEADRLLDEAEKIEQPGGSVGALLYEIAADLARHGRAAKAHQVAQDAVSWYQARDPEAYERETALALLLADRPEEAAGLMQAVVTEYPDSLDAHGILGIGLARMGDRLGAEVEAGWLEELDRPYLRGDNIFWRAGIASYLGEKDAATRLLRQAIREGLSFAHLHHEPLLAPLWGYEPFEQVIAPRG